MTCVLLIEHALVARFQCLPTTKNRFSVSKVLVVQVLIAFNAMNKGAFGTGVKRTNRWQQIRIANVSRW